jgi:hypothetical protein
MAHNKAPFDLALRSTEATAFLCGRFAADPRAVVLRFEDRFYDDPLTIEMVAATFRRKLSDPDRDRIFSETRREAIDAFIANLEVLPAMESNFDALTGQQDTYDPVTGWHKHHAGRKAEIGRWQRELPAAQVAAIEQRLGPWMKRFGYRPITPEAPPYVLKTGRFEIMR